MPPNSLRALPGHFLYYPLDPVAALGEAIKTGAAHDEGETQLGGRTVHRIRVERDATCGFPGCPRRWYVDPVTFYPIATDDGRGLLKSEDGTVAPVTLRIDVRFLAYQYLPRTEANVALTDIRAQHPTAKGP